MLGKALISLAVLTILVNVSTSANAQSRNLLQNPNADSGATFWHSVGEATVETTTGTDSCFVVRNGGHFFQDVDIAGNAAGQYIVLIGRGASERINPDGALTGLPYLYGYLMEPGRADKKEILAYLEDQGMRAQTTSQNEWVNMWGIFKVPERTKRIRFFLSQVLREGVPHNGSAARFDDLGLYLFTTKGEAEAFVAQYH